VNRRQIAQVTDAYRADAVRVVAKRWPEVAEDAVHAAVIYLMRYRQRFDEITKSYFLQLASNAARNLRRGNVRHSVRVAGVGGAVDLEDLEHRLERNRRGRDLPKDPDRTLPTPPRPFPDPYVKFMSRPQPALVYDAQGKLIGVKRPTGRRVKRTITERHVRLLESVTKRTRWGGFLSGESNQEIMRVWARHVANAPRWEDK
jgi:hypothetical protein